LVIVSRLQPLALRHELAVEPELAVKARYVLSQVISSKTASIYERYFNKFAQSCSCKSVPALPATVEDVARFFVSLPQTYTARAMKLLRTVIRMRHLRCGFADPTQSSSVDAAIEERLRTQGVAKRTKILFFEDFLRVIESIGTRSISDLRDRAIFLCAYFGALQLQHLQTLRVERTAPTKHGLALYFDVGNRPAIHLTRLPQIRFCPVSALQIYVNAAGIHHGSAFIDCHGNRPRRSTALSRQALQDIVHKRCENAGLIDPTSYRTASFLPSFVVAGHEAGLRMSELIVRSGMQSESVELYRQYARTNRPTAGSYLGF
jgi:hypothetical protein